jgi:hypothetical protein
MADRRISADEAQAIRRDQLRGDVLEKVSSAAPSSWNAGQRSARFVMTSQAKDRYGDVVMTNGVDTTEFMKNAVAFVNHRSSSWPVGKWQGLQKYLHAAPPRMEGTLHLGPSGGPIPEVEMAAWSLEHGMLRAASIGFLPDWDQTEKALDANGVWDGGLVFHAAELIECSLCGIPANPQALAKGIGKPNFGHGQHLPSQREVRQRKREIELDALRRGPSR